MRLTQYVVIGWAMAGLAMSPLPVKAQSYPNRPITLIIHAGAGGAVDMVNRLIAEKVSAALGQPIVLEFRPGGGSTIGPSAVARAQPDGYTIGFIGSAVPAAQGLGKRLTFDVREFVPVGKFMNLRMALAVTPKLGVTKVADLVEMAKASPGSLNFSSSGHGSASHLAAELFMQATGTKLTQIPYQSDTMALQDVVSGQVEVFLAGAGNSIPLHRSGKVRLLAITGDRRAPAAPDIPTFGEAGLSRGEYNAWGSWVLPRGTAPDVAKMVSDAFLKVTKDDAIRKRFADVGIELVSEGPEDLAAFLKSEVDKFQQLSKSANIHLD